MPARWRTATTQVQTVVVDACWRPMVGDEAGDFHDVVDLKDGRVAVIIGDAPGFGPAAAAFAERLRGLVRQGFRDTTDAAAVFSRVDAELVSADDGVHVASALCMVIDPAAGEVQVANAGHPPPVMVAPTGPVLLDGRPDPLLGVAGRRRVRSERLPTDGAIFLYTDGVVERRGTPIDESLARLAQLCTGLGGPSASAAELARRAATAFGDPSDDASVIAVRLVADDAVARGAGGDVPMQVVLRVYLDPADLRSPELRGVVAALARRLERSVPVAVETFDVTSSSSQTEDAGVLAAPTIVRLVPRPPVRVIGWVRSPDELARSLQLPLPEEVS